MDIAIVTGVSKGLGEQIARHLLTAGIGVIGVSRTENPELAELANEKDLFYQFLAADLSDEQLVATVLADVEKILATMDPAHVYLVNNAAMLEPVDYAHALEMEDVRRHYQINLFAPMAFVQGMIRMANEQDVKVTCGNVTSGAASRAISGWSAYSSSKAAINMYTRSVAGEQEALGSNHQLFAFSPGVMDTNMQDHIRQTDEAQFPDVEVFRQYKEAEQLLQPADVAHVFVAILLGEKGPIQSGEVYHMADFS